MTVSKETGEILAAILDALSRGEAVEIDTTPETAPILRAAFRAFRSLNFTECIDAAGRHYFRIDPPKGDPER